MPELMNKNISAHMLSCLIEDWHSQSDGQAHCTYKQIHSSSRKLAYAEIGLPLQPACSSFSVSH